MNEDKSQYEPLGKEWEAEMMKMTKTMLVDFIRKMIMQEDDYPPSHSSKEDAGQQAEELDGLEIEGRASRQITDFETGKIIAVDDRNEQTKPEDILKHYKTFDFYEAFTEYELSHIMTAMESFHAHSKKGEDAGYWKELFRAGYRFYRDNLSSNPTPYDESAEATMNMGYQKFLKSKINNHDR
jgi:hypothetical protein